MQQAPSKTRLRRGCLINKVEKTGRKSVHKENLLFLSDEARGNSDKNPDIYVK
jgi:hypothetical protein